MPAFNARDVDVVAPDSLPHPCTRPDPGGRRAHLHITSCSNALRARSELFRSETRMGPLEPVWLALFWRSGFTPDLVAEATAERVLLVTAEDVVAGGATG